MVDPATLSDSHGNVLLAVARGAVEAALGGARRPPPDDPWLREPGSTFVTLTQGGLLRGCIGTVRPVYPLVEDLRRNAVAAALADPRFHPLSATDLPFTRFEVSVLSPLATLRATSEEELRRQLAPGSHGLVLSWQRHSGTFLPQMWEQLPDPALFLRYLKRKAGLPEEFWDPEVVARVFTVRAWHEPEPAAAG